MSILPPKNRALRVMLTAADRDVLEARAKRSGITLSAFVRLAIRTYIHSQTPGGVVQEAHRGWVNSSHTAIPKGSDGVQGA